MRIGSMIVLFVAILCSTASADTQPTGSKRVFADLILTRIRAFGRGDVATYMPMLSEGFVHVSDRGERRTKKQMREYVRGGTSRASYRLSALSWRIKGDLAIVDAVIGESLPSTSASFRETDLFVWRGERWLYLQHQETPIVQSVIAVAVRGDRLADYIGRYRSSTGTVDDITVKNGLLFDRMEPDDTPVQLVHVGRGAFGVRGDPTLTVFLRDGAGKVTGCLFHSASGQATVSQRLK